MITEIIPGVYSVDQAVADGKNAIVVGERAAWAIDTAPTLTRARRWRTLSAALGANQIG